MATTYKPGHKNFHIYDIPPELHQNAKIIAAAAGVTMNQLCIIALMRINEEVKKPSNTGILEKIAKQAGAIYK